jgi:hypothetical protein
MNPRPVRGRTRTTPGDRRTTAGVGDRTPGRRFFVGESVVSKRKAPRDLFDPRLKCGAESLSYDFRTREGRLDMPAGQCCDMDGAVKLFAEIDRKVQTVRTFAGGKADTVYRKDEGGGSGWGAHLR